MPSGTTGATGLAGRYASALYDLAESEKALDTVSGDLDALGAMIGGSADLERLIRSPVISRADQGRAMAAILEKAGAGGLSRRFVGVVAENGRLFALPGMIAAYKSILAARRGEATAEVTSAKALTDGQLKKIVAALKAAVGTKVAVEARGRSGPARRPGGQGGLQDGGQFLADQTSTPPPCHEGRLAMKGAGQ